MPKYFEIKGDLGKLFFCRRASIMTDDTRFVAPGFSSEGLREFDAHLKFQTNDAFALIYGARNKPAIEKFNDFNFIRELCNYFKKRRRQHACLGPPNSTAFQMCHNRNHEMEQKLTPEILHARPPQNNIMRDPEIFTM